MCDANEVEEIGRLGMDGIRPQTVMQRANGQIKFGLNGSRVTRLYQSGSSKILLPKTYGAMREAVLLNTAGGITGGDIVDISIEASDCRLVATSQTAERLYKSSMHPARISIDLNLDKAATLHWLPQETIIFQGAAADRTINLNMSADSSCLIVETIILGRQAMGEKIEKCYFTDNWRLYKEGILFHAESLRIGDDVEALMNSNAGINGSRMISTIICVGANTEYLKPIIEKNLASENSMCAATYLNEKLIVRLVSNYSAGGRTDLNKILCALRGHPMPRVWQT